MHINGSIWRLKLIGCCVPFSGRYEPPERVRHRSPGHQTGKHHEGDRRGRTLRLQADRLWSSERAGGRRAVCVSVWHWGVPGQQNKHTQWTGTVDKGWQHTQTCQLVMSQLVQLLLSNSSSYVSYAAPWHVRARCAEKRPPEEVWSHGGPVEHRRHVLPRRYRQPSLQTVRRAAQEQRSHVRSSCDLWPFWHELNWAETYPAVCLPQV